MANFQFGHGHHLYIGHDGTPAPDVPGRVVLTHSPGDAGAIITVNNGVTWEEYATIRDVSVEGSPTQVDITTRADARKGTTAQAIVSTQRTLNFQIRYKPNESFSSPNDRFYRFLLKADKDGAEIALMELDSDKDLAGALGIVSNFNVSLSQPKPVQDIVVVDVTATATTITDFVVANATGGDSFEVI
jgi:hypothetical protein